MAIYFRRECLERDPNCSDYFKMDLVLKQLYFLKRIYVQQLLKSSSPNETDSYRMCLGCHSSHHDTDTNRHGTGRTGLSRHHRHRTSLSTGSDHLFNGNRNKRIRVVLYHYHSHTAEARRSSLLTTLSLFEKVVLLTSASATLADRVGI